MNTVNAAENRAEVVLEQGWHLSRNVTGSSSGGRSGDGLTEEKGRGCCETEAHLVKQVGRHSRQTAKHSRLLFLKHRR